MSFSFPEPPAFLRNSDHTRYPDSHPSQQTNSRLPSRLGSNLVDRHNDSLLIGSGSKESPQDWSKPEGLIRNPTRSTDKLDQRSFENRLHRSDANSGRTRRLSFNPQAFVAEVPLNAPPAIPSRRTASVSGVAPTVVAQTSDYSRESIQERDLSQIETELRRQHRRGLIDAPSLTRQNDRARPMWKPRRSLNDQPSKFAMKLGGIPGKSLGGMALPLSRGPSAPNQSTPTPKFPPLGRKITTMKPIVNLRKPVFTKTTTGHSSLPIFKSNTPRFQTLSQPPSQSPIQPPSGVIFTNKSVPPRKSWQKAPIELRKQITPVLPPTKEKLVTRPGETSRVSPHSGLLPVVKTLGSIDSQEFRSFQAPPVPLTRWPNKSALRNRDVLSKAPLMNSKFTYTVPLRGGYSSSFGSGSWEKPPPPPPAFTDS